MWTLDDCTRGPNTVGYLRISKDGKRVADVFPFAPDTNEKWARDQAARIVDEMNRADAMIPTPPGGTEFKSFTIRKIGQ